MEPDFAREGPHGLPRLARALKGWMKMAPNQTRPPMPEAILDAMTDSLLHQQGEVALMMQIAFSAYLRPSELGKLCVGDVIPPVKGVGPQSAHVSLLLSPFERGVWSKTRRFDEAILLDDPRALWLGEVLLAFRRRRISQLLESGVSKVDLAESSLWSKSMEQTRQLFLNTGKQLGVPHLATSMYVLRHGGASRDVLMKVRDLVSVMRRGRWAHLESVKHYEKHGRISKILAGLPISLVQKGVDSRCTFRQRFLDVF